MQIWNVTLFDRLLVSVTEQKTAEGLVALLNNGTLHGVPGDPAAYVGAKATRAPGPEAAFSAVEEVVADVIHVSAPDAMAIIRATINAATLDAMHAQERLHPKYDGGRRTVLDAIEERKGELTTDEPNVGAGFDDAG